MTDLREGCHLAADRQSKLFVEKLQLFIVLPVKNVDTSEFVQLVCK